MPKMAIVSPSTVGRGKKFVSDNINQMTQYFDDNVKLYKGDSLNYYGQWEKPTVIISDGGYGILGFDGDTAAHSDLPLWYEKHIQEWSKYATPQTTLWFWNSEIGWASVHPVLERYGWKYVNCNIWDKGKGHIAGNINTRKIRRFPVVTEVCAHYVYEAKINNLTLKDWLRNEWKRTGLPWKKANEACGVKDVAVRKYFDKGHLWYFPPIDMFEKIVNYANLFGVDNGKPYFSIDGKKPLSKQDWGKMRSKFYCPHGYTNVWNRSTLRGDERIKLQNNGKAAHLNQKPLDLMMLIIESSSDKNDVVWEPFGGLFSGAFASKMLNRRAYGAEIDLDYFNLGINRFKA